MIEFFNLIGRMFESGFTWAAIVSALLALEKHLDKRQNKKLLYLIAKKVGVEWDTPQEELRKMALLSYKKFYSLSHRATKRQKRRMNMKAYLAKLGKTKFQAFLIITFTNIIMLIGSVTGMVDIDGKLNEWMPAINVIVQMVVTWVYTSVEGSIDRASIQATGQEYTTGGTQDAIPPTNTDSNK